MVPMIDFLQPGRLWLLTLVAAIAILYAVLSLRFRGSQRSTRTRLDLVIPRDSAIKRHLSVLAALLALASLVVAYAQPMDVVMVPRERATVVITIDISRSMRAQDVSPSRIEAAQTAAKEFVDALPTSFNVAVVAFGGTTSMVAPPTMDRGAVKRAIDSLQLIPATAVGEAIFTSLDALQLAPPDPDHPDEPAPGAIVLLSDGYTTRAANHRSLPRPRRIRASPSTPSPTAPLGGYVYEEGVRVPVPVNHGELLQIAQISGGKKCSAESLGDLRGVYQTLSRAIGYEESRQEVTERYAFFALLFSVLAAAGVISLAARWP